MLQETTVTEQWQSLSCLVFCATTQLAQQWQRETCKEDLCLADFGTRCSDDDVELLSAVLCYPASVPGSSTVPGVKKDPDTLKTSQDLSKAMEIWKTSLNIICTVWIRLSHGYILYYILYSVLGMMQWWGMIHMIGDCSTSEIRSQSLIHWSELDRWKLFQPTIFTPPILSKSHRPSKGDPRKLPANSR